MLLDRGADPNDRERVSIHPDVFATENTSTTLVVSAMNGLLEVVQLLLDRGADPNAKVIIKRPPDGPTVSATQIMWLLQCRCSGYHGEPILIAAAKVGHLEVVQLLLERGADPNAADRVSIQ